MKRFVIVLFILLWFAVSAFAGTIPMSGTIRLANGNLFTGSVRFILSYSAAQDFNAGNIVVASTVQYPVNNGVLPANAKITPNDTLSPMFTWYTAQYINASGALVAQNTFYITGQSFNLGTATPTPVTTSNISFNTFNNLDSITVKSLDNRKMCDSFPGANAGAKMAACMAAVSNTGGIADASGIIGAGQTCTADPFASVGAKPVTLIWPTTQVACSASLTVPANVTVDFQQGGILSMATATTATVVGEIAGNLSTHFGGSGHIVFSSTKQPQIYPQWWGAKADGVTDDYVAIQAAEDAIISGAVLNTAENGPAGVVFFPVGTYYFTQPLSTCHFNGCPGGGPIPPGVINACVTFRGANRGGAALLTDKNIDMIDMFSDICSSSVESLTIASSGTTTGIRVRGNQTTIKDIWFHIVIGIVVDNTATIPTSFTSIEHVLCDSDGIAAFGPGNCIELRHAGMFLGPNLIQISDLACFGLNLCIYSDGVWNSYIHGIVSDGQGSLVMQLNNAHGVTISDVAANGSSAVQVNEDGIEIISSENITISNYSANNFQGPALVVESSTGVVVNGFVFKDDSVAMTTPLPYEVVATNSELTLKGGSVSNSIGHPTNAIFFSGDGSHGSYDVDGVAFTGTALTGTVILTQSTSTGSYRLNIENSDFRTSWAANPLISMASVKNVQIHHNSINVGAVTTWLNSISDSTQLCVDGNNATAGNVLLGSGATSVGTAPNGCFTGALPRNGDYAAGILVGTNGGVSFTGITFALLGLQPDGTMLFCTDCKNSVDGATWGSAAAGSGTGTLVMKENGNWIVK